MSVKYLGPPASCITRKISILAATGRDGGSLWVWIAGSGGARDGRSEIGDAKRVRSATTLSRGEIGRDMGPK